MSKEKDYRNLKNIKNQKNDYIKDNVFDKFDISDLIRNDLYIHKVPLENFFYQKEIQKLTKLTNSSKNTQISSSLEDISEEIFLKINNNNFGIKVNELILTFKNGYKVPFIKLYTPIDLIGQGAFGIVLSVIDVKRKKKIAVKIIAKNEHKEEFYLIEAELLKKLNHEKILKFHNVINTDKYLFIFTDLCEGGSLKDFIIARYNTKDDIFIKDSECSIIIKNILQGIEYLSQNGVIHRDLKPENIMFKNSNDLNSLVICDLGIAGELKNIFSFMDDKCGTLTFMAPEVLMERPYDNLVDIWSIGIIMYILESGGSHPLLDKPKTKSKYIEDIKSKKQFVFPKNFPLIARNLFLKMCKYEACFRYDVNKSLEHPWITRENENIPLTVIDNLLKKDKITTFKEMLMTMIFLKQCKNIFNYNSINAKKSTDLMKRKLKIKKGNISQDLYPSPFANHLILKKKLSCPINEIIFTKTSSKYIRQYKNMNTIKFGSFNTDKKKNDRYNFQSKRSFGSASKNDINKNDIIFRHFSHNKVNECINKKELKTNYRIVNYKKSNSNLNNEQKLETPNHIKKKSNEGYNRSLTIKIMKNKENLDINCSSNKNIINHYSSKKISNLICSKISNKYNYIEPKNLFHNTALQYIGSNSKKKLF